MRSLAAPSTPDEVGSTPVRRPDRRIDGSGQVTPDSRHRHPLSTADCQLRMEVEAVRRGPTTQGSAGRARTRTASRAGGGPSRVGCCSPGRGRRRAGGPATRRRSARPPGPAPGPRRTSSRRPSPTRPTTNRPTRPGPARQDRTKPPPPARSRTFPRPHPTPSATRPRRPGGHRGTHRGRRTHPTPSVTSARRWDRDRSMDARPPAGPWVPRERRSARDRSGTDPGLRVRPGRRRRAEPANRGRRPAHRRRRSLSGCRESRWALPAGRRSAPARPGDREAARLRKTARPG